MFQVHGLRVFFLSRHVSLREACDMVTEERLFDYIQRCIKALERLGINNAKMAVAGLNPHSGEHGLFGDDEVRVMEPAIKRAQEMGFNVLGPVPADSVFYFGLKGRYDAILSLYHDQGHIATKMVDFERTIAITNNLPFLRTSVDHGTAFDQAGLGIASELSLVHAIDYGIKLSISNKEKKN
jgi:4-hydroxythreonine-4-phosphate dehydrogenase